MPSRTPPCTLCNVRFVTAIVMHPLPFCNFNPQKK
nr:MAG TPA: hypothetical protein [Caudoviricetes sp.]